MLKNNNDNDCPNCEKDNKWHRERFKDFDEYIKNKENVICEVCNRVIYKGETTNKEQTQHSGCMK